MGRSAASRETVFSRVDQLLNYDFCPWANQWVYWMKHPLVGISVAAVSAGLCGLYVSPQAWLFCAGLLLVGLLGLAWPLIALAAIQVQIRFEQAWCEEGTPVRVKVKISNRLPCPVWGLSLTGGLPGETILVSFTRVAGWKTTNFVWELIPSQRGLYPDRPMFVETGFPFGVWTARKTVKTEGELIVFPKPVELDAVPEIGQGTSFSEVYSDRKVGDAGDVTGTRLFREGDSLRRVHWALTARHGRLICCERQAVLHSAIQVQLDISTASHSAPGPDSSLEWSIRLFAGICRELMQQGLSVTAVVGTERISLAAGQQGYQRLLLKLARIPAEGVAAEMSRTSAFSGTGIAVLTSRSRSHQAGIQVLLIAEEFEPVACSTKSEDQSEKPASQRQAGSVQQILIHGSAEIGGSFRKDWRKICHAVS